ncbi:MAG: arginase family protein, partial [Bergeyella zoohelcum]|nr:arginase family protein [Bergeyella zoohelcum]
MSYKEIWNGRFDGSEPLYHRIFQRVSFDETINENDFVLHGFAVDEGVRRNKGRVGAKDAPDVIRRNMANFPVVSNNFVFKDLGNVYCENQDLEKAQNELAIKVEKVLKNKAKSVVFGGGHEVTYAHYSGLKKAFPNEKIG